MKDITIFVEGDADKKFLIDFVKYVCEANSISLSHCDLDKIIIKTGGWTKISSKEEGKSIRDKMEQTTKRGGINLIIYDADDDVAERKCQLQEYAQDYNLKYEVFLLPDDNNPGTLEDLLERLINPENQCVLDCWKRYEEDLKEQIIPWKYPKQRPTTPSSKSKIYAYLEALVGTTNSEKERIKDPKRDFTVQNHWHLDAEGGEALKQFLLAYL